ncbi:uncharacterized protein [Antedon mediterranea]|uniref:uncharacterized protein n=1 Tax=Antedon mediterranea TaxID=105859 RepID=UPI003AF71A9E
MPVNCVVGGCVLTSNDDVILAVLHYNEHSGRAAAKDRDGNERFSLVFPRAKSGGYTLKRLLTDATFAYVDVLISEPLYLCSSSKKNSSDSIPELSSPPPPVCSTFVRPDKDVAISD